MKIDNSKKLHYVKTACFPRKLHNAEENMLFF